MRKGVYSHRFKTYVGSFCLRATSRGLYSLERIRDVRKNPAGRGEAAGAGVRLLLRDVARKIRAYLEGHRVEFRNLPIDWTGYGKFDRKVLDELRKIPWGRTESYQSLARRAGRPRSARHVGRILHWNRLPFILPCHRIILKSGRWGGFSQGVRLKRYLLKLESRSVDTDQVGKPKVALFDRESEGVIISKNVGADGPPLLEKGATWKLTALNVGKR